MNLAHRWNVTEAEARAIQQELRHQVKLIPLTKEPELIGGADISFNLYSDDIYAGIIILRLSDMQVTAWSLVADQAQFPYIPGLLSFREIPSLLKAWDQIPVKPDVMMMDGQGVAHPRRLGIAAHFGLLTGCPSFGCAKSLLTGKYQPPSQTAGSISDLLDKEEKIGIVLRTKNKVNPVFISAGHKITHKEAVELSMRCVTKYRIPEPTRQAHLLVNRFRKGEESSGYHKAE